MTDGPPTAALPYRFAGARTTPRLLLRPFLDADRDALARIHCDAEVARWLYWDARTPAELDEVLARKRGQTALAVDGDVLALAGVDVETGELVLDAVLVLRSAEHAEGELGYSVAPAHQGRGLATEATRALLAIGFDEVRLHRIIGRLEPRNVASGRVLERAGLRREALLVDNEWVKGEWQSEAVYALLAPAWRAGDAGR